MLKKFITWQHVEKYVYKELEYSDEDMITLSFFLGDGIGIKPFIEFLQNSKETEFFGNISELEKRGKLVKVSIDDYIYPGMPPFTTTIENLIMILEEFKRLRMLEIKKIELILDDENLTITGHE